MNEWKRSPRNHKHRTYREQQREKLKDRVWSMLSFLAIIAALASLAIFFMPGCYTARTFGHMDFPLTLLPEEMITENVKRTIEADPTVMVTLQFSSRETLFGGAKVQESKKDVDFTVTIDGFMTIKATGGRSLTGAEVDGSAVVESFGGAVGEGVAAIVGIP